MALPLLPLLLVAGAQAGMGGFTAFMDYKSTKANAQSVLQAAKYEAAVARVQAENERREGRENVRKMNRQKAAQEARTLAAYARSGVMVSSGTPVDAMGEQAASMEADILNTKRASDYRAYSLLHQAKQREIVAKDQYRRSVKAARIGMYMGMGKAVGDAAVGAAGGPVNLVQEIGKAPSLFKKSKAAPAPTPTPTPTNKTKRFLPTPGKNGKFESVHFPGVYLN